MSRTGNMYQDVKTWPVAIGCRFGCSYCETSFQKTRKRIVAMQTATKKGDFQNCDKCFHFVPHEHPNILNKFPPKSAGSIVWPCGHGDISFIKLSYVKKIVAVTNKYPDRTFYWQSKDPKWFHNLIPLLSGNSILLTTLETNRDQGYHLISNAPVPSVRAEDFRKVPWKQKIVTIEPVMDFDLNKFSRKIIDIYPDLVWIGFNSKQKPKLPEPSFKKFRALIMNLLKAGIFVKIKSLRDGKCDPKNVSLKETLERIAQEEGI